MTLSEGKSNFKDFEMLNLAGIRLYVVSLAE